MSILVEHLNPADSLNVEEETKFIQDPRVIEASRLPGGPHGLYVCGASSVIFKRSLAYIYTVGCGALLYSSIWLATTWLP